MDPASSRWTPARIARSLRFRISRRWHLLIGRVRCPRYPEVLWELHQQSHHQRVHEEDFHCFARLQGLEGLFVDVGANRGQSTLSLFNVNQTLRVHAFEPNPDLEFALIWLKRRFPRRFRYDLAALGDYSGLGELAEPVAAGADMSPSATLKPSEFDKGYVRERLAEEAATGTFGLRRRTVPVRRLDDYALAPLVVKIDVEGTEAGVLRGMHRTLASSRPMLMIELNNAESFVPYLETLGYAMYRYEPDCGRLRPLTDWAGVLNLFALHRDGPPALRDALLAGEHSSDSSP